MCEKWQTWVWDATWIKNIYSPKQNLVEGAWFNTWRGMWEALKKREKCYSCLNYVFATKLETLSAKIKIK